MARWGGRGGEVGRSRWGGGEVGTSPDNIYFLHHQKKVTCYGEVGRWGGGEVGRWRGGEVEVINKIAD